MASFKALFCLYLHALFLISSSGTRLFHPFSIADQLSKEEAKAQIKASTDHKLDITDRHFESKQFSGIGQLAWAVAAAATEQPKASKQFRSSSSKPALMEEGREAIKASIQRHGGIPFESKRLSPGGPDPHHH